MAPLTHLTSTKTPFSWTPQAASTFDQLKKRFAAAPILVQGDPQRQFVVEIVASDVGVGAVLSQIVARDNKLHPSAFFPHCPVIHWAHTPRFSCHPGVGRTVALFQQRFWWPSLYRDIKEYVLSCPICACNKASYQPPSGLLHPLHVPKRSWSHIALDFVSALPESRGFISILTIVDRFSKSCHLVPLRTLPSAMETAQLLVKHVFRFHSIPLEIL